MAGSSWGPQNWLKQIKKREFLYAFFSLVLMAVSGIWVVLYLKPTLLLGLDAARWILLSAGIMVPLSFFNAMVALPVYNVDSKKDKDWLFKGVVLGTSFTAFALSASVVLHYLVRFMISYSQFTIPYSDILLYIVIVGLFQTVFMAESFYKEYKGKRHARKSRAGAD